MRLSRRSEYGLRALTDLVRHQDDGPIALATLADRNRLPPKFLEQIMSTLRHAGVVRTTLGARGGYALGADPSKVSVGRVIRLLDGALAPLPCVSLRYYGPCSCPDEATCSLRDVMLDVRDAMLEILDNESLADLAARQGRDSIDPRGRHADALAGLRPQLLDPDVEPLTEDFFRELERARLTALVQGDLSAARALHAPDYQLITPGAAVLSADDYIGGVASGALDYLVFEPASEIAVRIFETGAAVRYRARIEIRVNGDLDRGMFWHTDLYERRDGRWLAVWSQATRIRETEPSS